MGRVFPLTAGRPGAVTECIPCQCLNEKRDFSFRHYSTSLEAISLSLYFWILPLAVVGNSSTK